MAFPLDWGDPWFAIYTIVIVLFVRISVGSATCRPNRPDTGKGLRMPRRFIVLTSILLVIAGACGGTDDVASDTITVYSGRSEELVAPLIERFEEATGISVAVRYAGSAELAATILEEGINSPADVFFAQDPASLGAVALGGYFQTLDNALLDQVDAGFSDDEGRWVGISGRARVVVYDSDEDRPGDASHDRRRLHRSGLGRTAGGGADERLLPGLRRRQDPHRRRGGDPPLAGRIGGQQCPDLPQQLSRSWPR